MSLYKYFVRKSPCNPIGFWIHQESRRIFENEVIIMKNIHAGIRLGMHHLSVHRRLHTSGTSYTDNFGQELYPFLFAPSQTIALTY